MRNRNHETTYLFYKEDENVRFKLFMALLPVMHSFCHCTNCQLRYGPNQVMGVGHTDGEWVERFWSGITEFVRRIQRSTDVHRWDTLVHYFEYVAAMQIFKYATTILDRAERAVAGRLSLCACLCLFF